MKKSKRRDKNRRKRHRIRRGRERKMKKEGKGERLIFSIKVSGLSVNQFNLPTD